MEALGHAVDHHCRPELIRQTARSWISIWYIVFFFTTKLLTRRISFSAEISCSASKTDAPFENWH